MDSIGRIYMLYNHGNCDTAAGMVIAWQRLTLLNATILAI